MHQYHTKDFFSADDQSVIRKEESEEERGKSAEEQHLNKDLGTIQEVTERSQERNLEVFFQISW